MCVCACVRACVRVYVCVCVCVCTCLFFHIILDVNCCGRTVLYVCIEYRVKVNMYHVSAQGIDERMVSVLYCYA